MTAQFREILHYKTKVYHLDSEPLESYFELLDNRRIFLVGQCTACYRGYVGTWEIENDKLYLIGLKAFTEEEIEEKTEILELIFPNQKKVFAGWFSGEIKILQGKEVWGTYGISIHEEDWYLKFNNGILMDSRIVDNKNRSFNVGRINSLET
jgi:hypothetical protein